MLKNFAFCVLVGAIFGFLAGIGVGGGSLLTLWLTVILGMPHAEARTINLLFFLPTAIISSLFRRKQRTLSFRQITPAIIGGTISAAAFSFLSPVLAPELLKKAFGILLLFTGIRELFYRPRNAK